MAYLIMCTIYIYIDCVYSEVNPAGILRYSSRTLSSVLNQCSVGGFTGCCTVNSDGPQVPYMVFASTEGC